MKRCCSAGPAAGEGAQHRGAAAAAQGPAAAVQAYAGGAVTANGGVGGGRRRGAGRKTGGRHDQQVRPAATYADFVLPDCIAPSASHAARCQLHPFPSALGAASSYLTCTCHAVCRHVMRRQIPLPLQGRQGAGGAAARLQGGDEDGPEGGRRCGSVGRKDSEVPGERRGGRSCAAAPGGGAAAPAAAAERDPAFGGGGGGGGPGDAGAAGRLAAAAGDGRDLAAGAAAKRQRRAGAAAAQAAGRSPTVIC